MIVIGHLADQRIGRLDVLQVADDLLVVGAFGFNGVEQLHHGGISKGAVRFGSLLVAVLLIAAQEGRAAGQLFDRRTFDEAHAAFRGLVAHAVNEGVGLDAGNALELNVRHAELDHLSTDAHARGNQTGEVQHLGIKSLDLGRAPR